MAKRNKFVFHSPSLRQFLLLTFLLIAGAVLYVAVLKNTERRSKAAPIYLIKAWEFNTSGDFEGWTQSAKTKNQVVNGKLEVTVTGNGENVGRLSDADIEARVSRREAPFIGIREANIVFPEGLKQIQLSMLVNNDNPDLEKPTKLSYEYRISYRAQSIARDQATDTQRSGRASDAERSRTDQKTDTRVEAKVGKTLVIKGEANGQYNSVSAQFPEVGSIELQSISLVFTGANPGTKVSIDNIHLIQSVGIGDLKRSNQPVPVTSVRPTYILQGSSGARTACTDDVMQCDDGSYVSRNPNNNCAFFPCP